MRREKRSIGEQVKSGFFIALRLIFGFLVFGLATIGTVGLYSPEPGQHLPRVAAGGMVIAAAIVMFVTADRWGGFVAGFLFLPGAARAFGSFLSGYDYSYPPQPFSRMESAALILYCVLVIGLVWRFIGESRKKSVVTFYDRTALTVFALSICIYMARPQSHIGLVTGLIALLLAWTAFRWNHRKRVRRHSASTV